MDNGSTMSREELLKFWTQDRGLKVFPVHDVAAGSCSCGEDCGSRAGKHPRIKGWQQEATNDWIQLAQWSVQWPECNWAVATGVINNVVVLDVDGRNGGLESLRLLETTFGTEFLDTFKTRSGSGDPHLWYSYPEGMKVTNRRGTLPPGIDVRGDGGLVLIPPSRTAKGVYTLGDNAAKVPAPLSMDLVDMLKPSHEEAELVLEDHVEVFKDLSSTEQTRIRSYTKAALNAEVARLKKLRNSNSTDGWDITTFEVACNVFELSKAPWTPLTQQKALDIIRKFAPPPDHNGWSADRINRKIESAISTVYKDNMCRAFPEDREENTMDVWEEDEREKKIEAQADRYEFADLGRERYEARKAAKTPPPKPAFSGSLLQLISQAKEFEYDYIVPNLLAKKERLVITGFEGSAGKTTLLRQIAVSVASGLHPFTHEEIPARRVLYIDLENGAAVESNAFMRLFGATNGRFNDEKLSIQILDTGLNLASEKDRKLLFGMVEEAAADLLIMGPVYKMCGLERAGDAHAQAVQSALDTIRSRYNCAQILEQHTPKTTDADKQRVRHPYGSQLWLGWPEFGKWLGQDKQGRYILDNWRGDRIPDREWPEFLARTDDWPWSVAEEFEDDPMANTELNGERAAKLYEILGGLNGKSITQTELATRVGVTQGTIVKDFQKNPILRRMWEENQKKDRPRPAM